MTLSDEQTKIISSGETSDLVVSALIVRKLWFNKIKAVSCGDKHTAFITIDDELYTFGNNEFGQLGYHSFDSILTPNKVNIDFKIKSVSCGSNHTAFITTNDELYSFGNNSSEQLCFKTHVQSIYKPTRVNIDFKIKSVSCGGNHTAFITNNHELYSFGNNSFGQLGLVKNSGINNISNKVDLKSVYIVSCGYNHTACITTNHNLYTFGDNKYKQLGRISYNNNTPVLVHQNVDTVSCGVIHTAFITTTKELYTFGTNEYLQLNSTNTISNKPEKIYDEVKHISCGYYNTIFVKTINEHDTLYAFGKNCNEYIIKPFKPSEKKIKSISCGRAHFAFITDNNNLYVAGDNTYGQLGIVDKKYEEIPISISEPISSGGSNKYFNKYMKYKTKYINLSNLVNNS
jgi:alpha-tubulin suppressor-like RCC1 family protein